MDENNKLSEESKEAYVKPTLFVHGDVEVITQGFSNGPHNDFLFSGGYSLPGDNFS